MANFFDRLGNAIGGFINMITGQTAAQEKQNEYNAAEAQKQRDYEAEQAQIQRDYEERLSNTAYQRQMADIEQAGLNPAMLYANSSASGASTPTGSAAKGSAASGSASGGYGLGQISSVMNSAANMARAFNNDKNQNNDINHKDALNSAYKVAQILGFGK